VEGQYEILTDVSTPLKVKDFNEKFDMKKMRKWLEEVKAK